MSRKSQKPVILLHGALGCAADFIPLQAALNGKLPTVAIDLPGHGALAASNIEQFSVEDFAETLYRYSTEEEPLDIFGYSMGGYVALYFAAQYPERVRNLFTLGTKLKWTTDIGTREAARLNPEHILDKAPHFAVLLAQRHGTNYWTANMRRTAAMLQVLGEAPPLAEALFSRIQGRTCVARGSEDTMVTREEGIQAVRQMKRGVYLELPGQPHLLERCDIGALANAMSDFFSS